MKSNLVIDESGSTLTDYLIFKRIFDVIVSMVIITILMPVFFVIIAILALSRNGIFFSQIRIGRKGPFKIIKFVTMKRDSHKHGLKQYTLRGDSRVTFIGKILRFSKMNELTQFFNVLKGDMSIVGPRPLIRSSYDMFSPETKEILKRVKPGITSLSSVIFRDEEKIISQSPLPPEFVYKQQIIPVKASLIKWYYLNRGLRLDMKIILLTGLSIVFPVNKLIKQFFKGLPENFSSHDCEKAIIPVQNIRNITPVYQDSIYKN